MKAEHLKSFTIVYYRRRWVFVPLFYIPKDAYDEETGELYRMRVSLMEGQELLKPLKRRDSRQIKGEIASTIRETILPWQLPIEEVKQLCLRNDILASMSLSTQAHANVDIGYGVKPINLYCLSVAESGERKSAVDKIAIKVIKAWQKAEERCFLQEKEMHRLQHDLWEKKKREALNSKDAEKLLLELPPPPIAPLQPYMICEEPSQERKYVVISGSSNCFSWYGNQLLDLPIVLVESDLDAMLLWQEAGNFCLPVALGSCSTRPSKEYHSKLRKASKILYSLDWDEAGKKAYEYWRSFPNLKPWPAANGKSIGDDFIAGVKLLAWVSQGVQIYT